MRVLDSSRAVLNVGTACSTGFHVPLARSSLLPGSACLRRAPCNEECRRLQLPWYSPPLDTVVLRHATEFTSMSFAQGLSASTDAPVAAALLPPRSTPVAHRASAAILNSKDLRDDQYPQPKGVMGNAGTTAMLLSLSIAVGNKLVGVVRGHWLRVRADRKKLAAQSRRIKRLEGELRAARAAAMEAAEANEAAARGSGGGGGVSGSGGSGSGADDASAGVAEALAVARAAQAAADSLRVQLAAAEQAAEAMETRARREMVQQEDEKLELEEAAAAAVAQMTQANEFAEAVRVTAASRVEQLVSALTAAGVPVPAEAPPDQASVATAASDGEREEKRQAAPAEAMLQKSAFQTELENARRLMRQALGMQDDSTH